MKGSKFPKVFICADARDKAFREANKFYKLGKEKGKAAWEAAMYPLAHLVLREGVYKSPLDVIELTEIERIVITHVFYPLDEHKDYSAHSAKFKNPEKANNYLNNVLGYYIDEYPLLDVFCKQHSHPGFGMGFLSSGDLNHSIFNAYNWYRRKGLNTMISIVMTPDIKGETWKYHCFGLRDDGRHKKLDVEIISKSHRYVKEAKEKPYYCFNEGAVWCDNSKVSLVNAGYKVSRNILRRGWKRYTLKIGGEKIVICIPPFFPSQTVKVYKVTKDLVNPCVEIILPKNSEWAKQSIVFGKYDILGLVKEIEGEI